MRIVTILVFLFASPLFAGGAKENDTQDVERIVSLSPATTEILFAIGAGDEVVGRTDFCNYPQEVSKIASVGGFSEISMEAIVAQEPDLVIASVGMHDYLKQPLEDLGITVFMSNVVDFTTLYSEIAQIAKFTGDEDDAAELIKDMKDDIADISEDLKNVEPKSIYWEVWNAPYMSVGEASYINELIALAGGANIFADVAEGYPVVSEESIIAANPQYIGVPTDTMETAKTISGRAGWQDIEAVKNNNIIFITGDLVSRPGPRAALAVEELAEKLYPDVDF